MKKRFVEKEDDSWEASTVFSEKLPKFSWIEQFKKKKKNNMLVIRDLADLSSFKQIYIKEKETPKNHNKTWLKLSMGKWI